ncbi:MAG: metal-sensitive transcriptional regulator [Atopobiaceae bacterium]|nr:metal-sensitive transcriptional regulator [Atopobiaceae bacterium]
MIATENHSASQQRKICNRLKRAQGQLAAVIAGLENGRGCEDTLMQLAAVTKALERAEYLILSCAVQQAARAEASGEHEIHMAKKSGAPQFLGSETLSFEQLEKLFMML